MKTTVKASVTFLFDSRRNKEGIYTICWNIYFNGKQKPFSTGIKISKPDMEWLKENKAGVDGRQKDPWRRNLWHMLYGVSYLDPEDNQPKDSLTIMAQRVIDSIRFFTFEEFKVRINDYENLENYGKIPTDAAVIPNDLLKLLQQTAIELKENDQIGSYSSHMDTRASLIRFCEYSRKGPELPFESITVGFLNEYEKWMLKYGKAPRAIAKESNLRDQARHPEKYKPKPASEATVGVYTRYIRKMMLIALSKKLITEDEYPFKGNKSFTIPAISNAARALELEDVGKIMHYQSENDTQALYRDLWIFSYLSNGLNVMDTCNLKWGYYNVAQGTIRFFREKTKRTSKGDKKEILIHLFPEAVEIIGKWATKGTDADDFIFPFFKRSMDAARRKSVANQVVIMINQTMAVVSEKMELPFRVTSNDARDTQATVLMKSGAPLPFIQSVLGHHDLKTTQKYFGRFSSAQSKEIMFALLPNKEKIFE